MAVIVGVGEGIGLGLTSLFEQADINTLAVKPDITTPTLSSALDFTPASNRRTYNQLLLRFHAVSTEA